MNILQVNDLKTYFHTSLGVVRAVDGVSFGIEKGSAFGIVGESGSGKTVTALSILKLISPPGRIIEGTALFDGVDLLNQGEGYLRQVRGSRISVVFQEPASAFNPVFTVGYQVAEAIIAHQGLSGKDAGKKAMDLLDKVHVKDSKRVYHSYPHQLSGGMKQRAMIAMAIANSPDLIILDEPTTALDVTIQAQILDLLDEIRAQRKLSILFISHDFGIIARMCGRVAVMYKGKIVETGKTSEVLNNPKERYTISLLESVKALS